MAPFGQSTRPRRSLPEGYQFGDAAPFDPMRPYDIGRYVCANGTHLHIGFAERCVCGKKVIDWNVIEGEHFDTNNDPGDEG